MATLLEREEPDRVTANMAKAGRAGKVFVDWSQNDRHKTTACAYSLRARPAPVVSAPLDWDEVARAHERRSAQDLSFTADEVLARVAARGDPFADVLAERQRLPRLG